MSPFQTATKKVNSRTKRWYKDVGLGFKTPAEAINGTYIGKYAVNGLRCSEDIAEGLREAGRMLRGAARGAMSGGH